MKDNDRRMLIIQELRKKLDFSSKTAGLCAYVRKHVYNCECREPLQRMKCIYRDCRKAMFPTVFLWSLNDGAAALFGVYMAGILGGFADAVFAMDGTLGMEKIWTIALCIMIQIFVLRLINMQAERLMFVNALKHDRMVWGRFLQKKYIKMIELGEGETAYRIDWDATNFRCEWVTLMTLYVTTPVILIYLMVCSFQVNVWYAVITFLLSLVRLVAPAAVGKIEARYDRQTREYNAAVGGMENDICKNAHTIALFGIKTEMITRIDWMFEAYCRETLKKNIVCKTLGERINFCVGTCCTLCILLCGAVMVANSLITPGSVAAMMGYFSVFYLLMENTATIIKRRPILKNLADRMLFFYEGQETDAGEDIGRVEEIQAENLSFSYKDSETNVFEMLNFCIAAGSKIAVCGPNGKGKSTLIKVLCGLFEPYGGNLKINGIELSKINRTKWHRQIAYVEQEPYLFSGTVEDNVQIGNLSASKEVVRRVMREVGIEALAARKLEAGKDGLSGGEKQRVAIARALLKEASVLILDEPGNHLDDESLAWLEQFIREFKGTILFVSHQERLAAAADMRLEL